MMENFSIVRQDEIRFICAEPLASMYKLSPCVWAEDGRFQLLLRVVNYSEVPSEKIARIHYGTSTDGLEFTLEKEPVIPPAMDPNAFDSGGCEDPTLAHVDGTYYVYYSGWNERMKRGEMLLASGPDIHCLEKQGIALESTERAMNPKEATIVRVADGTWRLFFEYAHENKSKIGLARSANVDGPWEVLEPLFEARQDSWDNWHLSTGPILNADPMHPVMFYNGATQNAKWRIGWVEFDAGYTKVVARSNDPLVLPNIKRHADDTDIAFGASALEIDGAVHLYYSVADQYCIRAIISTKQKEH
jgi:predicted GH43/DUF377 family glycosyl hydrolase